MYKTEDFFYQLPKNLIAQKPTKKRDNSRLLVFEKKTKKIFHTYFYNLPNFLQAGDVLILNDSKVFKARLIGKKYKTGGEVEIFLHQEKNNLSTKKTINLWECLLKGKIKKDLKIILSSKLYAIVRKDKQDGTWLVEFNLTEKNFLKEVNRIGQVPLPPYIKRNNELSIDKLRYQTVFAQEEKAKSVAAPTAGLHFSRILLNKLKKMGVKIEFITLHVGLGTFSPVKVKNIKDHKMHKELLEIKAKTIKEILKARQEKRRIIAVGTTSCRVLEAVADKILLQDKEKKIEDLSFATDIFIYPGYNFKIIQGLITNFHLPKSTLLMLVGAFTGKKEILAVYQEAVAKKYRFFSYGDAMLVID